MFASSYLAAIALSIGVQPLGASQTTGQALVLLSRSVGGGEANAGSFTPRISPDGSVVAFKGFASNLVPGDTNDTSDLFVLEISTGVLRRASLDSQGNQVETGGASLPVLSRTGRYLGFRSAGPYVPGLANGQIQAFLKDLDTEAVEVVSVNDAGLPSNGQSTTETMSADVRWVVFTSRGTNLHPADTIPDGDVYVRDRVLGITELISVRDDGVKGDGFSTNGTISADGRFVVFSSNSTNLVPGDTNGWYDMFVRDRWLGTTRRISVGPDGVQGDHNSGGSGLGGLRGHEMEPYGRLVAWQGRANSLVPSGAFGDIFIWDHRTGSIELVSLGTDGSFPDGTSVVPTLSWDGRFVAFRCPATNLTTPPDTNLDADIFLRDRLSGTTTRISEAWTGGQPNGYSEWPSMSADGRRIVFTSAASDLVPNDTNGWEDIFLWERTPTGPETYCLAQTSSNGCEPEVSFSGSPTVSAGSGFEVRARDVERGRSGLLVYSTRSASAVLLGGGVLCLRAPLRRTPVQTSGGTAGVGPCSGRLAVDFNAWIAGGSDPALVPGETVWAQFVSRDPDALGGTNVSEALTFDLAP